jgi:hypothetical protein
MMSALEILESKHKQSSSVLENLTTHVDRNYWKQIASSTSHSQGHSGYASSQLMLVPQPEIAFSSNENYDGEDFFLDAESHKINQYNQIIH